MASFVEQATLLLNDKASKNISKINRELQKLFVTAKKMSSTKIALRVTAPGAKQAETALKRVDTAANRLRKGVNVNVRVNTAQANAALNNLARKRTASITAGVFGGLGRSLGRDIAFGFKASIGNELYRAARGAVAETGRATISAEDAQTRVRQAGFNEIDTAKFVALSRDVQEQFPQVPAAEILNASVEQLSTLKAANATTAQYKSAMERVARNAQTLAVTYKDAVQGAEGARQLERLSQALGADIDEKKINAIQQAAVRATIASGGEMGINEAVRAIQQLGPTIAKSMNPQAITDLLLVRDEGGRQSTAEFRMAIQDLIRGSLNESDKAAMTRLGLRGKGGASLGDVANEASANLVDFTANRIMPILEKAGLTDASSAEIGAFLDDMAGFTTTGARALADIATSLRNGDIQRGRQAARRADLNPQLAANTFRGATQALLASFDTAAARNLDKLGPIFAAEISPVAQALDKAGKQAEQGNFAKAADTMLKAGTDILAGPAGKVLSGIALLEGTKTFLTATDPLTKAAGLLSVAGSALIQAAGMFGDGESKASATAQGIAALREQRIARVDALAENKDEAFNAPGRSARVRSVADDAIREFQRQQGLKADAIVGPRTIAAMKKAGTTVDEVTAAFERAAQAGQTAAAEAEQRVAAAQKKQLARDEAAAGEANQVGPIEWLTGKLDQAFGGFDFSWSDLLSPTTLAASLATQALQALDQATGALTASFTIAEAALGRIFGLINDQKAVDDYNKLHRNDPLPAKPPRARLSDDENAIMRALTLGGTKPGNETTVRMLDNLETFHAKFEATFGGGAAEITAAGAQAGAAIQSGHTSGGQSAASMISAAHNAGAAVIANAIRSAAASVKVTVQNGTMPNGPAPANAGATGGAL